MVMQKNIAQEDAINTIKGPVIVISCPGSGKTTTLIRRIKNIIDNGGNPKKILMITFANSAAKDMQERFLKFYGENKGVSFMTIHSLCFTILKRELGYTKDSLISETQKMEFLINRLKNNIYIADAWEMAKTIATEMSVVRNSYIPLKEYIPKGCEKELFVKLYNAYETEKKNYKKIDFDDMLVECEELLTTNKSIREKWGGYFDYIQVDEYQDTNQLQKDIIYKLIERTKNLCVVGDDDQSIYGWRGADPTIMMGFSSDFPKAKVINMSTNYRSSQLIVSYADTLIKRNKVRFEKDFSSFRGKNGFEGSVGFIESKGKKEEALQVIDKIKYLYEVEDVEYKDMAILFRTNKQAEIPAEELLKASVPFSSTEKIKSIYESYIFKDIKAYVELSMGHNSSSNLYTIINHPNRYLNIKNFKDLPFNKTNYLNAIYYLKNARESWKYPAAEKSIVNWFNCFGPGKITEETSPLEVIKMLESKDGINYFKHLKNIAQMKNEDEQDEIDIFNSLKEDASHFQTIHSWFRHANFMIIRTQEINRKKESNGVKLTTMHKSKGLEWKVVFVIGVNDGVLPGKRNTTDKEVEEERRVLYVGMTRAEDKLFISSSSKKSPFLIELEKDYKKNKNPLIKKKLPGAKVFHNLYGKGIVVRYVDKTVIINFEESGIKKILFPDAFQSGVCKYSD